MTDLEPLAPVISDVIVITKGPNAPYTLVHLVLDSHISRISVRSSNLITGASLQSTYSVDSFKKVRLV